MVQGLAALTMVLAGYGLTWLIQSTVLLALGLLAGRLWKRSGPAVESAVYRTALAAVLVCPVASAVLAGAGFDGLTIQLPLPAAGVAFAPASNAGVAQPFSAKAVANVQDHSRTAVVMPRKPLATVPVEARSVSALPVTVPSEPTPLPAHPHWWAWVAAAVGLAVWLLGSTVLGLRLWVGQRRMRRLRASAVPAEPAVEALCRALAGRMSLGTPAVLRSPFLFSPCLDGIRRPAILLPEDVVDNLRETFVHELAHLARRDGFWNLLRRCSVAALWVQPLVWLLSRRLEATAEEVCDDHVVQFGADRAGYASHLLELAGRALPQVSPTGVGMVSLRSLLARRVIRILDSSRVLSTRAGFGAVLTMLAAGLAGTLLASLLGIGEGKQTVLAQTQAPAKAKAVEIKTSGSLRVRLVDPAGAPLAGTIAYGRFPEEADTGDNGLHDQSVTRVAWLEPGKSRTVVFKHAGQKLGAVLNVLPDDPRDGAEVTVTLRPYATLTGRLVDAKGQPFRGGVHIMLPSRDPLMSGGVTLEFDGIVIAEVELDGNGRFRCDELPPGGRYLVRATNNLIYTPLAPMKREPLQMFAMARELTAEPGQIIDLGTLDVTTGQRIEAPPAKAARADVPIHGRIIDLEGRPVARVSVRTESVEGPKAGDLMPWINAVKKGESPETAYRHLDGLDEVPETAPRDVMTDEDGRFRLEGFGSERVVWLAISGDTIAATAVMVVTRRTEPITAPGISSRYGPGIEMIFGADFTYTASPSRPVEGTVRDAKTHQPLAGVGVRSYRFAGSRGVGVMDLKTTTDSRGRFRLAGLPKAKGNVLLIVPDDQQPYFLQEVALADPPGMAPVSIEIDLHRGIWIKGKVTEDATGEPVPDARLHYLPFLENAFAQATPEFNRSGYVDGALGLQDHTTTKPDGTYQIVGLPGRAIVGVSTYSKPYREGLGAETILGMDENGHFKTWNNPIIPGKSWPNAMKEIHPPGDAEAVHLDFEVSAGASVHLRVVDASGEPITGVTVAGCSSRDDPESEAKPGPDLEIVALAPGENRMIVVRHQGRKLGKVLHVRAGDDTTGAVLVRLESLATITGRVVDADGRPIKSAVVWPGPLPSEDFSPHLPKVATDHEGRFRASDVPTGCDYGLSVDSGGLIPSRRYTYFPKAAVRPSESTDVGEIRFKRE